MTVDFILLLADSPIPPLTNLEMSDAMLNFIFLRASAGT
jgi:hypothetical protein